MLQHGRIVEHGPRADTLFRDPQHPYTRRLLAARARRLIAG